MSYHDDLPASCLARLLSQPFQRLRVNPSRIARTKAPVGRRYANPSKIRHTGLRGHFSEDRVAIQTEIRPKRCSEKRHIPDLNAVVFQNMHVRALGNFFDIGNELWNFLPVELVVSQNVDYWPVGKGFENPFDSVLACVNVAGEHDHVSVRLVRLERRELQVEVAQDVDTHDRVNLDLIYVNIRFFVNTSHDPETFLRQSLLKLLPQDTKRLG